MSRIFLCCGIVAEKKEREPYKQRFKIHADAEAQNFCAGILVNDWQYKLIKNIDNRCFFNLTIYETAPVLEKRLTAVFIVLFFNKFEKWKVHLY